MMARILVLLCLALVAPASAFAAEPARLNLILREHAMVAPGTVRLRDVATIQATGLPENRRFAESELGRIKVDAPSTALSREEIGRWLRRGVQKQDLRIEWSGATSVRIEPLVQTVAARQFEECALEALTAWLGEAYRDLVIAPVSTGADLRLPAGALVLRARPVDANALPASRMMVWVESLVQGRVMKVVPVVLAVKAHADVAVAQRDLWPSDAGLDPTALKSERVDVAALGLRPWTPDDLQTMRLRKPVLAGQVLTQAHVEPVSAVTRGRWVELRASEGGLQIDATAQALQDGQPGDWVKVRVPHATAPLLAKVLAPGRVEVLP